ncbi:hypothetical protein E2562_027454 [Oryza meyeriana var. granulata]|uniref:Uncharacterized protein n=1 Tax=Oryza meyeriana var. granulata TaxID=110450 RepID=A0A6G1CI06_9ORYZ|nr:hypothetical protein E2562_027454 [Oryza meyeriana var. granulata]
MARTRVHWRIGDGDVTAQVVYDVWAWPATGFAKGCASGSMASAGVVIGALMATQLVLGLLWR